MESHQIVKCQRKERRSSKTNIKKIVLKSRNSMTNMFIVSQTLRMSINFHWISLKRFDLSIQFVWSSIFVFSLWHFSLNPIHFYLNRNYNVEMTTKSLKMKSNKIERFKIIQRRKNNVNQKGTKKKYVQRNAAYHDLEFYFVYDLQPFSIWFILFFYYYFCLFLGNSMH